ncbi:conserved repeat domain-containing protein [Clostridium collagenovorans DSM 3089]|uniref:Conserved repeat domain-containing protein n=1 Tax=Clostridium collagenovorans DSM 3089 TaxID=1121306 RepID=A0A1M5X699_9CLOT|nr:DUF11 domain-containing protein [Clostridium collagenovorans]SHH95345.1 conserved repeat domain-containing protein [Clostridium collagenovorans DSM 3089]
MSLTSRFSAVDKAILVSTGNSLVVCGDTTAVGVNTSDMITVSGTTTRDWAASGSKAQISILPNSTILYAELVWYSTVKSFSASAQDVRSMQDDPVMFITPSGNVTVTPTIGETFNGASGSIDRFRSVNVTSIVQSSLGGWYGVSGIPTSIPISGLSNTRAGWTLVVVYRNASIVPQKITLSTGIAPASEGSILQNNVVGFLTSSQEDKLRGDIFMAVANGEPLTGVQTVKVGPSFANLSTIGNPVGSPNPNPGTAPNNPYNSFFTGQVNICDPLNSNVGLIDGSGTNGSKNHDAFVPTQVLGARNKWDITEVNISNTLVPNQSQLAMQLNATGTTDGVQVVALGTQVQADAPNMISTLTAYDNDGDGEYNIEVGNELSLIAQIKNTGTVTANNVILSSILDSSCSFIPNSLKVNGIVQNGANITTGFNIGSLEAAGVVNVIFTIRVNSLPSNKILPVTVDYNYEFASSGTTVRNYDSTKKMSIIVQQGKLTIAKSASKSAAIVGDIIEYTIDITNIGTEKALDVFFSDPVTKYCSFKTGSVSINGVINTSLDPNSGFPLDDLKVSDSVQIKFKATINSIPPSDFINNSSCVNFSYTFNQYEDHLRRTVTSNTTAIEIQYTDIIGERSVDNEYPNIGDQITCSLKLTNIGNVTDTNIPVQETLMTGTSFVEHSVKIDGVSKPSLDPFDGFTIDAIGASQSTTISYKLLVESLDPRELIENIAKVPFKYQISTDNPVVETEIDSNKVTTKTNYVNINSHETVDKSNATIDNILYYSVDFTNTGNIEAYNTVFSSYVEAGTELVPNSVKINGVSKPGYDPTVGFSVGSIYPNNTVNVTFQTKVKSVPSPNIVYNKSQLNYNYLPDPNGAHIIATNTSNTVQTQIDVASFTVVKSVDKAYAQVGEPLVYQTVITNTGTMPLSTTKFTDNISYYLDFYPGTVYVNGVNYASYDPRVGFELGDLQPTQSAVIVFGTIISKLPPTGVIMNASNFSCSYKVTPDSPTIEKTQYSNEVETDVLLGNLQISKSVSKNYATIGDTVRYSIDLSNNGNATVNNVFFTDIIESAGSFVTDSVNINSKNKPGLNPNTGFSLGSIVVGQVVNITFDVTVNSLPNPNVINNTANATFSYLPDPNIPPVSKTVHSNTVTTTINTGSATLTKGVDKYYATVGDILTYTLVATNTGTTTLKNISLTDLIPSGATFNTGSVKVNDVVKASANPNNGFTIDDIVAGGNNTITFTATVTSVPTPNTIINSASMSYKYNINPNASSISGTATSNNVTTTVNAVTVTNSKSVDLAYATIGDTLNYTSVITNTGNTNITNVIFKDILDSNIQLVADSVKINNQSKLGYDPNTGFSLSDIAPNTPVTITFKVTVKTVPSNGTVSNKSNVSYEYKINPNEPVILGSKDSNTVTTAIKVGTLSVTKQANRGYAIRGDEVKYSFVISNTGNTLLSNLRFQDIIQSESTFKAGSIVIGETNYPGLDLSAPIPLGNLDIGNNINLSFIVTVNAIPNNNIITNQGSVSYAYYIDPNGSLKTKTVDSTSTTVTISEAILSSTKTVDKDIAKIGDVLNFTVLLTNHGNVDAKGITFLDELDSNISFDNGSVIINDEPKTNLNPNTGFPLSDISSNLGTTVVKFSATVISRPSDNIVENSATVDYNYLKGTEVVYVTDLKSNTTTTYIAAGELTLTKLVDKIYATVGDSLNYTINILNTGSVNATNLNFKDLMPNATSFVTGTVVVNGVSKSDYDPTNGFSIPDLVPNQSNIVSFTIHVDSLPLTGTVINTATTKFKYKLTPTSLEEEHTATSNPVTTYINLGKLSITKIVDKSYATIGDDLSYSITIKNIGDVTCSHMFFQDLVASDAIFKAGSLYINGVNKDSTFNPNNGFALDNLEPYSLNSKTITVAFIATVKSLPSDYMIYNTAEVNYQYNINPSNPNVSTQDLSNTVPTRINLGKVNVTKSVSKAYATIGDTLTYTINIANAGNVDATNVNFRDVVPEGLSFVKGSVSIDNIPQPDYNPYESFTLSTISVGTTTVVKFNAIVTSLPSPSLVSNVANVIYSYRINPAGPDIIYQVNSNPATTQINKGELTIIKQVDKGYATVGDVLTYTMTVTNTGNVELNNVIFTDGLQSDVSFNEGTVIVGGNSQPTYDPTVGFSLGTLTTLASITVSFTVTVNNNPTRNSIINYANGTFSYKVDPNGQLYNSTASSNTVSTIIVVSSMTANKTVDLAYATISNILNYKIIVKNTGTAIITALNFIDTLSNGATFVEGSVVVDGASKPLLNPINGFALSNLLVGATTEVAFQVQVTSVPNPSQITNYAFVSGVYKINPAGADHTVSTTSNTVSTQINLGSLTNTKSVDKMYAKVGDTITYTSQITNVGNVNAVTLEFHDVLQAELSYVSGSVRVNGVINPNLNPTVGMPLVNLAPGQTVTVAFDTVVNTLPVPPQVSNKSQIDFSYKIDPNASYLDKSVQSSTVTTQVIKGQLTATKVVDKSIATVGDVLTYTITIINTGNAIANSVIFQDIPSTGATFKTGTVYVNGTNHSGYDPTSGFSLGDIGVGNQVTVSFQANVVSVPASNKVTNQAVMNFNYLVDPKQPPVSTTSYSNTTTTNIALGSLSVTKIVDKKFATIGETLTYTITIVNTGNIDATNVVFLDPTPANSVYVIGTVKVNGTSQPTYNPAAGFALNTMKPGEIVVVVYNVKVIS